MRPIENVRRLAGRWDRHDNNRAAAAVAFYALLTLSPILAIVTGVAGQFFGESVASEQTLQQLRRLIGDSGAELAQTLLRSDQHRVDRGAWIAPSALVMIFAAGSAFTQLRKALNACNEAPPRRDHSTIFRWLYGRLVASTMVAGVGVLLTIATMLSIAGQNLASFLSEQTGWGLPKWYAASEASSLVLLYCLMMLVLGGLPSRRPPLSCLLLGAVISAGLLLAGKALLAIYLASTNVAAAYGAASAAIGMAVWVYYSTLVTLLGAEVAADMAESDS